MDQKYARLSLLQVDFLAQDELVEVHAYSDFPKLELTCGVWGPFQRLGTYMVPLWLALQLHTKRVVRVIPPSWLTPADLEQVCAAERMSQPDLSALPLHWLSVATLLLDHCPACFGGDSNVTQVRRAVENVRNIREEKLRMVIAGPPSSTTATTSQQPSKLSNAYLHLDNVSLLELNCIRDFTTSAMDEYASFRKMNPQPATPQQTPVKTFTPATPVPVHQVSANTTPQTVKPAPAFIRSIRKTRPLQQQIQAQQNAQQDVQPQPQQPQPQTTQPPPSDTAQPTPTTPSQPKRASRFIY